jgi:hypothetical protein
MVHSSPDGQTLAAVWLGPVTVSPHTMKVQYTPNDYIPVIQLTSAPYVFCVHPDFPATEGKSFIEELRKNPEKYTYGNDGAGGPGQLAAERIFRAMKVKARDIPFKGAGETATAFLGKHIDIYVGSVPPILQHAQAAMRKCVLLSSADRIASLPSASGLRDLGIPDEELILWRGVIAPKGTPPARLPSSRRGSKRRRRAGNAQVSRRCRRAVADPQRAGVAPIHRHRSTRRWAGSQGAESLAAVSVSRRKTRGRPASPPAGDGARGVFGTPLAPSQVRQTRPVHSLVPRGFLRA